MADKIERRKKICKRRAIERQKRREAQRLLQQRIKEGVRDLLRQAFEATLQGEVTDLLGRAKHVRTEPTDQAQVAARCNRCGSQTRSRFFRAGFYQRSLLTFDAWVQIKVPRVSCACGGMVDLEFAHLAPYERHWFDLEERGRELAGLCVSLRDSVQVLAWQNGQPISIATLNGLVNETADLADAFHQGAFTWLPSVVMLDGLWLKVMEPTDEEYVDKRGRHRKRCKLRKAPVLVAYGVDPVSGEKRVLDWERGEAEDEASWQKLLERLLVRGLHAERGLKLLVHDGSGGLGKALELVHFGEGVERQRCVFHKLCNVRRDVVGTTGMSRQERRERRQAVMTDAVAVYHGKDEEAIRALLAEFEAKWAEQEPAAMATLKRDFDQTLVYRRVVERALRSGEVWRVGCVRTTSPLERVQRQFRQKVRQVVMFHSERGLEAGIELVIRHRLSATEPGQSWARSMEEDLLVA